MENIKQNQDRCPICGSPHFIKIDSNEYQCENCGFLKVHNEELSEEKILVINAYSILRQGNYVDAEEAFDDILNKNKNNYEALWGKICSHHGIVFVEDNNKIYPTFHDIVDINFLEEKDYKRFLSICPEKLKEVYINLAKRIEDLRDKYYKQVLKEKPYDIFISFKASDETGSNTKDYIEATNLHSFLVEKGYKVFFSPVSLKEKTANEYEPYIYHALRTAKVMIVYGQKEEYFEAKWLKNEWGRFIRMIDEGIKEDGSLIVCYENMNPNNLPNRLKKLQCLNLSDKTSYITLDKVLSKLINEKKKHIIEEVKIERKEIKKVTNVKVNSIEFHEFNASAIKQSEDEVAFISIADDYLKDKDYIGAKEKYEKVLNINPSSPRALMGIILCKYKCLTKEELFIKLIPENINDLDNIIKSCDEEIAINDYINPLKTILKENIKENSKDERYIYNIFKLVTKYNIDNTDIYEISINYAIKNAFYDLFKTAIEFIDTSNVDKHIKYREKMQEALAKTHNDEDLNNLDELINSTLEIEEGNTTSLYNKFLSYVYRKSNNENIIFTDAIDEKAWDIFDDILSYETSVNENIIKLYTLIKTMNICVKPLVYENILKRVQKDEHLRSSYSLEIANNYLDSEDYEYAQKFYNYYLSETDRNEELGYVGLLYCCYKTSDIKGLLYSDENIFKTDEYENILVYSKKNNNEEIYDAFYKLKRDYNKEEINQKKESFAELVKWGIKNNYNHVFLGMYPQSLKSNKVKISEQVDKDGYYIGSDGEKYVSDKDNFYKVEPLRWEIIDIIDNNIVMITDNIIDYHIFDKENNNYVNSNIRNYIIKNIYDRAFTDKEKELLNANYQINITKRNVYKQGFIFKREQVHYETNQEIINDKVILTSLNKGNIIGNPTDYAKTKTSENNLKTIWSCLPYEYSLDEEYVISQSKEGYDKVTNVNGIILTANIEFDIRKKLFKTYMNNLEEKYDEAKKEEEKLNNCKKGDIIEFGSYPQTIKADNVSITNIKQDKKGYFTGSDGEKYALLKANPSGSDYTFSNGETIIKNKEYYFKVEPIKWKVLEGSNSYAFLFSELLLDAHKFENKSIDYATSSIRDWLNDVFYYKAFTDKQKKLINNTTLSGIAYDTDKQKRITSMQDIPRHTDKVYLLSEKEITNESYGFSNKKDEEDKTRCKKVTDYAKANYAYEYKGNKNGWYWLRTPSAYYSSGAYKVSTDGHVCYGDVNWGNARNVSWLNVYSDGSGVAPALSVCKEKI